VTVLGATLLNAVLQFASTTDCSIRDFQRELSSKLQNIHAKCIMLGIMQPIMLLSAEILGLPKNMKYILKK